MYLVYLELKLKFNILPSRYANGNPFSMGKNEAHLGLFVDILDCRDMYLQYLFSFTARVGGRMVHWGWTA